MHKYHDLISSTHGVRHDIIADLIHLLLFSEPVLDLGYAHILLLKRNGPIFRAKEEKAPALLNVEEARNIFVVWKRSTKPEDANLPLA